MKQQQNLNPDSDTGALTQRLAMVVGFAGLLVMIGWIFDIGWLKSIRPEWVTMKFATAGSFLFSGITLYHVSRMRFGQPSMALAVLPASLLCIILTMFTLLASTMFDVYVGIETLFISEHAGAVETVQPGRPSIGTMVAFLLVAFAGIAAMLRPPYLPRLLAVTGMLLFVIGLLAVIGYALDMPPLYYYVPGGISTAMALHTAILFVMLAIGLVRLK